MTGYLLELDDAEVARYRLMAQSALQTEAPQWAAAGIVEGASVADIGCGPGAVSAVLARVVGPTGTVLAVDQDARTVAIARHWMELEQLTNVVTSTGSATASGLTSACVDVVMLRHVLAHNGGHEQAIVDHLATLVRPGGCVYLADIEATAMRVRPEGPTVLRELTERYAALHASLGNDLSVGLRLGELLEGAGLDLVEHRGQYQVFTLRPGMRPPAWAAREQMLAAGVIDADDVARWQSELGRLDRSPGHFTMFMPFFTAYARRPV